MGMHQGYSPYATKDQVYYDAARGEYYTLPNGAPAGTLYYGNDPLSGRKYLTGASAVPATPGLFGPNANTNAPAVDFNALPQQVIPQAQAYVRPNAPTQPYVRPNAPAQNTGSGYRPQFDPSFIQQMLAQRFGNQQPNTGMPVAVRPTLTPAAAQTYGGAQGPSGLAGLRSIAGGTTDAT